VFPETIVFVILKSAALPVFRRPPPVLPVLSVTVQLTIVVVPPVMFHIPPPEPKLLPEIVQLVSVAVPSLIIPEPYMLMFG
jgi:hypothetical protein